MTALKLAVSPAGLAVIGIGAAVAGLTALYISQKKAWEAADRVILKGLTSRRKELERINELTKGDIARQQQRTADKNEVFESRNDHLKREKRIAALREQNRQVKLVPLQSGGPG